MPRLRKMVTDKKDKSKIKEDGKVRAYRFSVSIIKLADSLPTNRSTNILMDQLIRSSTSIGANIIEATASSSRRDFIKFYQIALKSANETKYWICLLRDTSKINEENASKYLNEAVELSKILGASLLTLKNKR